MQISGPVIIGGTGGSGTRVYHQLCSVAGFDMGRLNARGSHDSLPVARWIFPKWIDPYLKQDLNGFQRRQMRMHLKLTLRITHPRQDRPWGWKNARNLYLFGFYNEVFPEACFLHVIRDGRDCAFQETHTYRVHETCFLSPEECALRDPTRKALHWSRLNRWVEEFGATQARGRYMQCRLEDLCASPRTAVEAIYAFLGVTGPEVLDRGAAVVRPSSSLGRWRQADRRQLAEVERAIGQELEHYGYGLAGPTPSSPPGSFPVPSDTARPPAPRTGSATARPRMAH